MAAQDESFFGPRQVLPWLRPMEVTLQEFHASEPPANIPPGTAKARLTEAKARLDSLNSAQAIGVYPCR
jgi:hypothetical protein